MPEDIKMYDLVHFSWERNRVKTETHSVAIQLLGQNYDFKNETKQHLSGKINLTVRMKYYMYICLQSIVLSLSFSFDNITSVKFLMLFFLVIWICGKRIWYLVATPGSQHQYQSV